MVASSRGSIPKYQNYSNSFLLFRIMLNIKEFSRTSRLHFKVVEVACFDRVLQVLILETLSLLCTITRTMVFTSLGLGQPLQQLPGFGGGSIPGPVLRGSGCGLAYVATKLGVAV
jgi:hypothetical protein